jgi:hypothetical protein
MALEQRLLSVNNLVCSSGARGGHSIDGYFSCWRVLRREEPREEKALRRGREGWATRKPLDATNEYKLMRMNI